MNWNLEEISTFFEDKGYNIIQEKGAVFPNKSILIGTKK
jgi:hypothetical protein